MASHFKLYDGLAETVPWPARYSFPTQANRTWKTTVKLPPVNGAFFTNTTFNQPIRINFPATGYMDTTNTFLSFNLTLNSTNGTVTNNLRIQNDILSIFKRGRLVYGSLPLEDIREMHALCRILGEGGGTHMGLFDQTGIAEGKGGLVSVWNNAGTALMSGNARVLGIQCAAPVLDAVATGTWGTLSSGNAGAPVGWRRYVTSLPFGLFVQNKLIPLKFMASSLYMELEMSRSVECMCATKFDGLESFTLSDVAMIAEILDFDGSYDAAFLDGLKGDGVPLKYATWDTFLYSSAQSATMNFLIPERNRSIKAAFCVQLAAPNIGQNSAGGAAIDSHAFYNSTNGVAALTPYPTAGSTCTSFQWRVGNKYYPTQPCLVASGLSVTNGAPEAWREYEKAMNIVGDYRLQTAVTTSRWAGTTGTNANLQTQTGCDWAGVDAFFTDIANVNTGRYVISKGPAFFVISADFETSDGEEVSGINGEEQNDIALNINYGALTAIQAGQAVDSVYNIYVYYDALLILKEGNYVELVK